MFLLLFLFKLVKKPTHQINESRPVPTHEDDEYETGGGSTVYNNPILSLQLSPFVLYSVRIMVHTQNGAMMIEWFRPKNIFLNIRHRIVIQ